MTERETDPTQAAAVTLWGAFDGSAVHLYTLRNRTGVTLRLSDYGAMIVGLDAPDRDGAFSDIVLGFDTLDEYVASDVFFGSIVGRCANRIAAGRFELDGTVYKLATNNGRHHLHGGDRGFDRYVWDATLDETIDGASVTFARVSVDGEEGYPGALRASVTYTLTHDNAVMVEMTATTNAPTLCNLAQHAYWNLGGHASGSVEGHTLRLHASSYTPVDDEAIPTGATKRVDGGPFDFREAKAIGRDLGRVPGSTVGYDHNFVVDGEAGVLRPVAELRDPASGRTLTLASDHPGVQLYTGGFLGKTGPGKGGSRYGPLGGVCLETQFYPNAVNVPDWDGPVLRPGQRYRHNMVVTLGAEALS
ncbi:MAG: galactose-1-epimerase [Phycisphaerae bacterium]|nr:galactose-1-epimerase [Phycisphaerae bacterium]